MAKTTSGRRAPARRKAGAARRWSQQVTEHSDALDLERDVFTKRSPRAIAASR